jgi:multiple sugar transport system substrate-binding protein
VPNAALDNSQTENQELFLNEQVAMMINHPTAYAVVADKKPELLGRMAFNLFPEGPARRAAVFGGSNIHVFKNIEESAVPAALEFVKLRTNPEWSNRLAWFSNPGNRKGFEDRYFEMRKQQIKFLDVATKMLEYGVAFPVIPESTEILNIVVPTMVHNALTEKMTVDQAAADAEKQIKEILARRK